LLAKLKNVGEVYQLNEIIKKVIYNKLSSIPDKKALLFPDLQIAFHNGTGKSLSDYLEELKKIADELEADQFAKFEKLPSGMPRILKGVNFNKWSSIMNPKRTNSQINISSFNANNVQVGNENTMNVGVTPEEFVEALKSLTKEPEKAKSIIDQLSGYVKEGVGIADAVTKFMALIG
jgi:uncharacterized protein YecA (UPF0149 family)